MEAIGVLLGLGVVATAPSVRVLRPVIKVFLKTGMAVTEATVTVASMVTEQVSDLVSHARAGHAKETIVDTEVAPEPVHAAPGVAAGFDNADLLQIDGIGPKVSGILKNAGVETITQLATTRVERLQEILDAAGPRFGAIDPSTWPEQAQTLQIGA